MRSSLRVLILRFVQMPSFGLLAVSLLLAASLMACSGLSFPEIGAELRNPTVPLDTPTLAPLLLTSAPTQTPPPPSSESALAASPTPTFGLPLPEPTCSATPQWGLGDVWSNEGVRTRLGCQVGEQLGVQGEELYFANGHMLWRPDAGLIYVLLNAPWQPEGWGAFVDTFQLSDPDADATLVEPTPIGDMPIYMQPRGRFGKVWRTNALLRDRLGWARVPYDEQGQAMSSMPFNGVVQDFERGTLLWNGDVCFVLRTDDMSWDMY